MPPPLRPNDPPAVRVLLVDDDEDDYLITRDVVADIPGGGYRLDWVDGFDKALEVICQGGHDVYLVDYFLGGRTGVDLLAAMRERDCRGPVILLTGVGQPEIDRAAESAGAMDYLEKGSLEPVLLERAIRYARRQWEQEAGLERKIRERTAELAAANESLRLADKRKNEYLATLAHELRNPLAPIRAALAVLRMVDHDPAARERSRQVIERQLGHMVRLIDDLLDVARMTNGQLRLNPVPFDLADAVRTAVETTESLFAAAGVALDIRLPANPLPVTGDAVRLAQVFSNLLANAAKYTNRDGAVTVAAERDGLHVVVRVRDTGIGLAADALPQVFEMFARIDPPEGRSREGLGVGLSLVKRFVELHGGTVDVRSDGPGRGTEFAVRLPAGEG